MKTKIGYTTYVDWLYNFFVSSKWPISICKLYCILNIDGCLWYFRFEYFLKVYFFYSPHSLQASAFYVRGLQTFFQARYNEAKWVNFSVCYLSVRENILNACKELVCKEMNKNAVFWLYHILFVMNFRRYLRETLKMANAEDLNRLTSCSLVLLGHIFLSLGNNAVSKIKICTHFLLLILKWETIIVFMLFKNNCKFHCLLKMTGSTQYGHTRHAISWKNLRCPCTVVGVITPQR